MAPIPEVRNRIINGEVHPVILAAGVGNRTAEIGNPALSRYPVPKCGVPVGSYYIGDFGLIPLIDMGLKTINVARGPFPESVGNIYSSTRYPGVNFNFYDSDPTVKLNTAGNVARIVREGGLEGTIIVRSADIVSNIEPHLPLATQVMMNHGNGLTIVTNPVPWTVVDQFGTVRMVGMPQRSESDAGETLGEQTLIHSEFEDAIAGFVRKYGGESAIIQMFREKVARRMALSNLQNSSDYYISAELIRALGPALTPSRDGNGPVPNSFSDWGSHVFPVLASMDKTSMQRFPSLIAEDDLVAQIEAGKFPFMGFVMPGQTSYNEASFWADLGRPGDIWRANMAVLDGSLVARGLEEDIITHRVLDNGAIIVNSIVGHDVNIGPNALINNSVVREGSVIGRSSRVLHSVLFPGGVRIGEGSTIIRSLVTGGEITASYVPGRKTVYIVYENLEGIIGYSEHPIPESI